MKLKYALILLLGAATCLQSCKDTYTGFSKVKGEGYYRIEELGESTKRPKAEGQLSVRIWPVSGDSEAAKATLFQSKVPSDKLGPWWRILKRLSPGDSATLILPPGDKPTVHSGWIAEWPAKDTLRVGIRVLDFYSQEEWKEHLEKESWKADKEMNEHLKLDAYLKANNIPEEARFGGMYYLPVKEGRGRQIQAGDHLSVHYKSMFLDSTEFDNSYEVGTPLEFVLGKADQILPGFELGIRQMRVGGKAVFILPSQLGYGEWGSTNGLIPPYTTTLYQVEIIKVR